MLKQCVNDFKLQTAKRGSPLRRSLVKNKGATEAQNKKKTFIIDRIRLEPSPSCSDEAH